MPVNKRLIQTNVASTNSPTDFTAMSLDSANTALISGAGYGSNQFYIYGDGEGIVHLRMQYNSHYQSFHTFATPYDWTSTMTTIGYGNVNPSNNYQNGIWISNAGTTAIYGGYSNGNASGNDDTYKFTVTNKNSWAGYTFTTYNSTWRNSDPSPNYTSWYNPVADENGAFIIVPWAPSGYATYEYFLRKYSMSPVFDLNSQSLSQQVNVRTVFGLSVAQLYNNGTGYIVSPQDIKRDGTEILWLLRSYSSGTILYSRYYATQMTTPWDLSTIQSINLSTETNYINTVGSSGWPYYADNFHYNVGQGRMLYSGPNSVTHLCYAGSYGSNYTSYLRKWS